MEKMTGNLKIIMCCIAAILLALTARLFYIQLVGGDELAEAAREQCLISLEGGNTRGIIYDRNGAPLVADKKKYVYILKEDRFNYRTGKLLKSIKAEEISGDNRGYYVYSSEDYDKATGRRLIDEYGAYILETSSRYSENQTASELIGYLNKKDKSGAAGLELMFDERLSMLNRRTYAAADVKGNILPGRGLIVVSDKQKDSSVEKGVRTTIDRELQKETERIIDKHNKKCAVVILDVKTGGIVTMAEAPGFDRRKVDEYLYSSEGELMNRATQGEYAPGSVFKIVIAAAALENGVDLDKEYECRGECRIDNVSIGCETGGEKGHGKISFEDAFAYSCNSYFIQMGRDVGYENILYMAEKLGLGKKIITGYPQESRGHIMNAAESVGAGMGNLAIGQGQTLVTPMQVAAMTNIMASGGIDKGVHISIEEVSEIQVISKENAEKIKDMMQAVTEKGTAARLGFKDNEGLPRASVKTGTAEYGEKKKGNTHGWITGFAPCDNPEYTITVFMEDCDSGSSDAGPIYREILEYLEKSGAYSRPALA